MALLILVLFAAVPPTLSNSRPGNCSEAYVVCDKLATCIEDTTAYTFVCECQEGTIGDGFTTGNGCTFTSQPCSNNDECGPNGFCNEGKVCECNQYYQGNGVECTDVKECLSNPCQINADCREKIGAEHECVCKEGYKGDGITCTQACTVNEDCTTNAQCVVDSCNCDDGYTGNGFEKCDDVDECADDPNICTAPAVCSNTIGSFKCGCPNGYSGDGTNCESLPKTCEDLRQNKGISADGFYDIDPDFDGPLKSIKAKCEFADDVGITIIYPLETALVLIQDADITYQNARIEDIQEVVALSEFCYQTQKLVCSGGYNLFGSINTWWTNPADDIFRSWGGSGQAEKCACGILGHCENGETCNCDGTKTSEGIDFGKIINKTQLPITSVSFHPSTSPESASFQISELKCAPKAIDIEKDCDAIKTGGIYDDGPQLIDVDGADGPIEPTLVHCDMNKYSHVGLTVVPHDQEKGMTPSETGVVPLNYVLTTEVIGQIINSMEFCVQEVKYECKNAPIHVGNEQRVYVTAGNDSIQLSYFPGGEGTANSCACGITGSCTDTSLNCNCDINDDVERYDLANHTKDDDLPITSINYDLSNPGAQVKAYIGPLQCAHKQFGIEPNCEKYRAIGVSREYTYLIDPDGPEDPAVPTSTKENFPPFAAECQFNKAPPQGVTIIHHDSEDPIELTDSSFAFDIAYKNIIDSVQLKHIRDRSTFCGQSLKFDCNNYKLHTGDGKGVKWFSLENGVYRYLSRGEEGDVGCACNTDISLNCENDGICQCDTGSDSIDDGELGNSTHLPVSKLDFGEVNDQITGGTMTFTLGPLKCFETFPTCFHLFEYLTTQSVVGESVLEPGKYTIDPDKSGGDPPFTVVCDFPFTRVGISKEMYEGPKEGETVCHDIQYLDHGNMSITQSQAASLVKASDYCVQSLSYTCNNAPWTGHVNYTTCDGREQKGWSLSGGHDMCSCGMTGTCDGGAGINCNCDTEDGKERTDGGSIYNTTRLPVCQVCMTIDAGGGSSSLMVGSLSCSGEAFVGENSCQEKRASSSEDEVLYMKNPVVPVYCDMTTSPNIGIMEIRSRETTFTIDANTEFDENIEYFMHNAEDVHKLIDNSYYCTQEIFLNCNDGALDLSGTNGWHSRDGTAQDSWGGNIGKLDKCEKDGDNCNCNKVGAQTDGGIIAEKNKLPISRVKLSPTGTERTLTIGPVKCYELRPDCYDIMKDNVRATSYGNRTYVIDPDGADGVDPFIAVCFFDDANNNAITEVLVESNAETTVTEEAAAYSKSITYGYRGATFDQINTLARQAPFCYQGIQYDCVLSPITDSVQYDLYNGFTSSSFGNANDTNTAICPCGVLGTCGDFDCRCDGESPTAARDNGTITDKDRLPITEVRAGGQIEAGATSIVTVSAVRCEEKPQDIPEDCEDAKNRGYKTGEVLIDPSFDLNPFFVYCDMEVNPGHGTIVINPDVDKVTEVIYDGIAMDIPYIGLNDDQLKAVIDEATYCYQPVKYQCKNTKFLEGNLFYWKSFDDVQEYYFGTGNPNHEDCTCGNENMCGGTGDRITIEARKCNCDNGDDVERVDSGIMKEKQDLPIRKLVFQSTGIPNSKGNITVGKLYCGQYEIAFDECTLGFHDCHKWAECVDEPSGFRCVCPKKYRGLNVPDVWANGRDCYDDDECATSPCSGGDCVNFPGGYNCSCFSGYEPLDHDNCIDINECKSTEYPHNCDVNAKCINTEGSFFCKCKRGYKGAGTNGTCERIGICACFGDPHCISFDERWLDFMGECQYVMARDNCGGNNPTFQVWTNHWDMKRTDIQGISWVKDVTVVVNDMKIYLGPDRIIRINGRNFIAFHGDGISVNDNGREVAVITSFGLEVFWNGGDEVEVLIGKDYKEKTCGLCGNFNENPEDDWTVGPRCDTKAGQQAGNENIFGNSWAVQEYLSKNPTCDADCNAAAPAFSNCDSQQNEYYCDRVFNKEDSPFKECLLLMEDELYQRLRGSCLFDLCQVKNDIELGMCSSAERVLNECQKNYDVDIPAWRKSEFCELKCADHMEYRECGPRGEVEKARQRTCVNILQNSHPGVDSFCTEGCYCKPGYVLEGKRCILPGQCGCLVDGVYIAVNDVFINDDCTSVKRCKENSTTATEPIKCDANAGCFLNEDTGVFGCHCLPGFKGDGFSCGDDNCYNVTCPANMECDNAICRCKSGYTGDCNRCEDIDECLTKTHNCIHIGQNCSNTDGSYNCVCIEGYVPYGSYCLDIDECDAGFDNCKVGSECINTNGGFQCQCCAGYESNGAGGCIANGDDTVQGKCCSCNIPECDIPGKVCGNDGVTYQTERKMIVEACRLNKSVEVSYRGDCKGSCNDVVCPRPYAICIVDSILNVAQCICPKCNGTGDSVCSSRLIPFPSQCEFERIMCEINDNSTKIQTDQSYCAMGYASPVSAWAEWGTCSAACGLGVMTRSRTQTRTRSTYELTMYQLEETAPCYGNCSVAPCLGFSCPGYGQICVPSSLDSSVADCICPNCTNREDETLCGLVGYRQLTFKNKCELQKKACEVNRRPHILSLTACGTLPLNCSFYTKYQDLSDGDCVGEPVPVGICEGGCGISPDKCCEPDKTEMYPYSLTCANGTTLQRQVLSMLSCECRPLDTD